MRVHVQAKDLMTLTSLLRAGRENLDVFLGPNGHRVHEERGVALALAYFALALLASELFAQDASGALLSVGLLLLAARHYVKMSAVAGERIGLEQQSAERALRACFHAESMLKSMVSPSEVPGEER